MDRVWRIDLVLREERTRREGHDVETARDLRADDGAVVPVHGPGAAHRHARGVDGAAVEERDLARMLGIGPVEHRDAALIPRLHHHVASGDRYERAIVGDT